MTENDRTAFAKLLYVLGETFDTPVSDIRAETYFDALHDLPLAALQASARVYVRTAKFFPKPVELRQLIESSLDDQAGLAWQFLHREIRRVGYLGTTTWPDEATRRAALSLYDGTWRTLCENLPNGKEDTNPAFLGFQKRFMAAYTTAAQSEAVALLAGEREDARQQLRDLKRDLDARGLPAPGLEKVRG